MSLPCSHRTEIIFFIAMLLFIYLVVQLWSCSLWNMKGMRALLLGDGSEASLVKTVAASYKSLFCLFYITISIWKTQVQYINQRVGR